jgi:hypothetical protein
MIVSSTIRDKVMIKAKPLERVHFRWRFMSGSGILEKQVGQPLSIYSVLTQSIVTARGIGWTDAKSSTGLSNEKNGIL